METKDNVLAAIEAGEGLTPINLESSNISQNLTHQSQTQTSGIRFEIFEAIKPLHMDDLSNSIKSNNTIASEVENDAVTSFKQNQGQISDKDT